MGFEHFDQKTPQMSNMSDKTTVYRLTCQSLYVLPTLSPKQAGQGEKLIAKLGFEPIHERDITGNGYELEIGSILVSASAFPDVTLSGARNDLGV